MAYPFPQGTLSISEAAGWISRRNEWTHRESCRWICEAIRKGALSAYVLNGGRSYDADRSQFAALGDLDPMWCDLTSRQFASTTFESLDASCFPGKALIPAMPRLLPPAFEVRTCPVFGLLFFLESDFDAAWWEAMNPRNRVEEIAKYLRKRYPARPSASAQKLADGMRDDIGVVHRNMVLRAVNLAWPG
jgi:hypothetical protein